MHKTKKKKVEPLQINKKEISLFSFKKQGQRIWIGASKEEIQMASKPVRRCSISVVIRELQIVLL